MFAQHTEIVRKVAIYTWRELIDSESKYVSATHLRELRIETELRFVVFAHLLKILRILHMTD